MATSAPPHSAPRPAPFWPAWKVRTLQPIHLPQRAPLLQSAKTLFHLPQQRLPTTNCWTMLVSAPVLVSTTWSLGGLNHVGTTSLLIRPTSLLLCSSTLSHSRQFTGSLMLGIHQTSNTLVVLLGVRLWQYCSLPRSASIWEVSIRLYSLTWRGTVHRLWWRTGVCVWQPRSDRRSGLICATRFAKRGLPWSQARIRS